MNPLLNTPNGTTFNCIIFFVLTNRYGHPAQSTLEKLKNAESDIYITANVGQIKLILWKGDISVEEYVKTKNILLR